MCVMTQKYIKLIEVQCITFIFGIQLNVRNVRKGF